jgi:hypothetical protein
MNALAPRRPPRIAPAPDLPPIGVQPEKLGNGRVEIQIYPAATEADRVAAAMTLLHGTRFDVAARMKESAHEHG